MAKNDDFYTSNPRLKKAGVKIDFTPAQVAEYIKCVRDPIYFIKKYVKIVHVDYGVIPFEMWDFQVEMIRNMHENRFSIAKMPRQVGKTTSVAAYLLWCILFNENFQIAILANKHSMAKEIVGRIQMAYENLPMWIQQGIVVWNRTDMEVENGSKIVSSSTTGDTIRGRAFNIVYLDEFAFVPSTIQEEFFTSVYPTISSGKTTKIMITSTPNGMNMFYKLWKDSLEGRNTYKRTEIHWSDVPGRDEAWKEETIKNTSERQFQQEFETEFLGSSMTLISGSKLAQISWSTPIETEANAFGFKFYEQVDREHTYVMTVDTARGSGLDYSAFIVFDTSTVPFKVVCTFRNNNVSTIIFPKYIIEAATYYNNCYILVETNDLGQQVVDILREDLDYDGLISTAARTRGHEASSGFNVASQTGVRTTKTVKRLGCSTFKSIVESDQLVINDHDLFEEMTRFTYKKGSYEAENGHDDLVMCGVLFVRNIYGLGTADMDDMIVPFGVIDTGHDSPYSVDSGDLWTEL